MGESNLLNHQAYSERTEKPGKIQRCLLPESAKRLMVRIALSSNRMLDFGVWTSTGDVHLAILSG